MSIPYQSKKTTNHQVIKVTYDTDKMFKFMIINLFVTVLLIGSVYYMTTVVGRQSRQITNLANIVNELTYKIDEQSIKKPTEEDYKISDDEDDEELFEEIGAHFEFNRQYMKKVRSQIDRLDYQMYDLRNSIKNTVQMIQYQSKSSWYIKEIIANIMKKLEFLSTLIENINISGHFDSMKDKIKGTFSNIKDTMGNMFDSENDDDNYSEKANDKKGEGMFDGMKDRFKRGWRSYNKPAYKEL